MAEVLTHRTLVVAMDDARPAVEIELYVQGRGQVEGLVAELVEIEGVLDVRVSQSEE